MEKNVVQNVVCVDMYLFRLVKHLNCITEQNLHVTEQGLLKWPDPSFKLCKLIFYLALI